MAITNGLVTMAAVVNFSVTIEIKDSLVIWNTCFMEIMGKHWFRDENLHEKHFVLRFHFLHRVFSCFDDSIPKK
jgi:hypothetical protein